MKRFFYFMTCAAMLALVGCGDETQSELTESMLGLSGEATIRATFYYDQGARTVDGVVVSGELLPVPNTVKVIAQVDYSNYCGGDADVVFKQFEATAKGNGEYELVIPAGEKKVSVTLIANGFTADYYESADKAPIQAFYTKVELPVFDVLAGQEFIKNNTTIGDVECTVFGVDKNFLNNDRTKNFTVKGKLKGYKEVWDAENTIGKKELSPLSGIKLKLTITTTSTDDTRELEFTATTNDSGAYSFDNLKLYDAWFDEMEKDETYLQGEISVNTWKDENFKHYYMSALSSAPKVVVADPTTVGEEPNWDYYYMKEYLKFTNTETGYEVYVYSWKETSYQTLVGVWNVGTFTVNLQDGNVILWGEALDQDLTAEFTPKDLSTVLGLGPINSGKVTEDNYGTVRSMEFDNGSGGTSSVKIPQTLILFNTNPMGW